MTGGGHRRFLFFAVGIASLAGAVFLSLTFGATSLDLGAAISGVNGSDRLVLLYERLPRTFLAALVGASLSTAGLVFQAILANPLADPFIIGVAGGAALGGTLAMLLPFAAFAGQVGVSLSSFVFAIGAIALTYRLSRDRTGRIRTYEVLLIGVVFNAFASAVIMFLKTVVRAEKAQEMLLWLMGTLSSDIRGWDSLSVAAIISAVAMTVLYSVTPALNALSLGEEDAASVGVDPGRVTRIVFVAGSLLVAAAVSVAGLIGFVGLIVPHAVRAVIGSDHRATLPACALYGATFLILADLATRVLFPVFETEAPVGVLTALIGGPMFVYLLKRGGRRT
ncbi:MAG: iron ABC transporter permease [Deltaproteobacteria bacterium]|nr:iron ABC transporter permease [Deltaproteobacteria bacterium]